MGYLHLDTTICQNPKKPGRPCGDLVRVIRTAEATTMISCDGIGSGTGAHLAAQMTTARLAEQLAADIPLRRAFGAVVRGMERVRQRDDVYPYAVCNVARIGPEGTAAVLNYEAPRGILISERTARLLRHQPIGAPLASEADCVLAPGDALLLVSDGITQAGLGNGLANGWSEKGLLQYVNRYLAGGGELDELAEAVHKQALSLWGPAAGDDCTVLLARARKGVVANLLTGPPSVKGKDRAVARDFLAAEGQHIVCGATTAEIVARQAGQPVQIEQNPTSLMAPPKYEIQGVDLVTEGAVTLNQAYNILDADPGTYEEVSGVTELCDMLRIADRVNLTVGAARNPANTSIRFRQQGIIQRQRIANLLADKLQRMGKLVVYRTV